ncbi:hypothetical protein HZS_6793 [Henneguya salminicola]|nr:hypothetical protein HZS_6793 [Henneguya salminicola]
MLTCIFPIISVQLKLFIFFIWLYLVLRNENEYRYISFEDNNIKIGETCVLKDLIETSKKVYIFAGSYTTHLSTIFIGVFSFISLWLNYLVQALIVYIISFLHSECYLCFNFVFLSYLI